MHKCLKWLNVTVISVVINTVINVQLLGVAGVMLTYKTVELSISKTRHENECLFNISAVWRSPSRGEWSSGSELSTVPDKLFRMLC